MADRNRTHFSVAEVISFIMDGNDSDIDGLSADAVIMKTMTLP